MFRNQKFTTIFKSLIIVAIFFSCYSVTLAAWTPPTDTPPACNPATPGCNPPVNVSVVKQTKPGILGLGISELIPNFLTLAGVTPIQIREYFAGFSNRIVSESNFLNIFGHGTSPDREVKIWDNLTVPGDIRANNYYICSGDGTNCNLLGGTTESLWSQNGSSIYYNSGNVGIGTSNPSTKLEIGGVFKLAPQSLATDPAGTNGMVYYNQNTNKFRCYEGGSWFNCFSGSITPPPTSAPAISNVTISNIASGWPSGEIKQVNFNYANFSGNTNTVTVSVCHPLDSNTCLIFSPSPETLNLSGNGSASASKQHALSLYQRLLDRDLLITPYFDGFQTKLKVCPSDASGNISSGGICAFSSPYSVVQSLDSYTLTVRAVGNGTVAGGGTYRAGMTQTVTATPNTGHVFSGWSGDCSGANPLTTVIMNGDKTCTATFTTGSIPAAPSDLITSWECDNPEYCNIARLDWLDNSDNETGFKIEGCSDNYCYPPVDSKYFPEGSAPVNSTTFIKQYLTVGRPDYFRVRAVNGDIVSSPSAAVGWGYIEHGFMFYLDNQGNKTVARGGVVTNSISLQKISGTEKNVIFSGHKLVPGISTSFNPAFCKPTTGVPCTSTMTINVSTSVAPGTYEILVLGEISGGGNTSMRKVTTFNLTVQ